jgi:hypothetical protein
MFYRRHHDLVNRNIIYISIMTTELFYGRHHDLGIRYRYYVTITQVMVATVEHIRGH